MSVIFTFLRVKIVLLNNKASPSQKFYVVFFLSFFFHSDFRIFVFSEHGKCAASNGIIRFLFFYFLFSIINRVPENAKYSPIKFAYPVQDTKSSGNLPILV